MLKRVKVIRTIWPYNEGYGVVITHPFKADTILDTGLTKEEAETMAESTRKGLKGD